jgi:hypothetical protein
VLLKRNILVDGNQNIEPATRALQQRSVFQPFESGFFDRVNSVSGEIKSQALRRTFIKQQFHIL